MKLHFEKEDLTEREECSALTSNLEGTTLNCVMAKKQYSGTLLRKSLKTCQIVLAQGCKDTKQ